MDLGHSNPRGPRRQARCQRQRWQIANDIRRGDLSCDSTARGKAGSDRVAEEADGERGDDNLGVREMKRTLLASAIIFLAVGVRPLHTSALGQAQQTAPASQ